MFETVLRPANFESNGVKNNHFYITAFRGKLPADIVGGSSKYEKAPKTILLQFGNLTTDTDIPSDARTGRPRTFFRDRDFVERFFQKSGARPGDTVLLEPLTPYHLRLRLRRTDGTIVES